MEQKFEQVAEHKHLYKRRYQLTGGGWKTIYYARFVCRLKGKRRHFSLGSDFTTAKEELTVLEAMWMSSHEHTSPLFFFCLFVFSDPKRDLLLCVARHPAVT